MRKSPERVNIFGLILSESYQRCKIFVRKLRKHHKTKFLEPNVKGYLEVDWMSYLGSLQKALGGQTWAVQKGVVVIVDDLFIGGEQELFNYYKGYVVRKAPPADVKELATAEYLEYFNKKNLLYTHMDVSLNGTYMGTLLFELCADSMPNTCRRFATLCNGKSDSQRNTTYKSCKVVRLCKNGWFQAGRIISPGIDAIDDEPHCYSHDRRGVVSFANPRGDPATAEFFVTFTPSRWMDRNYVAFGRVVEGWHVLNRIEDVPCTHEGPDGDLVISDCGIADVGCGKDLKPDLKMKGLTAREPHISLQMFTDIVMDAFSAALFNRLDREVRNKLDATYMGAMIWEKIEPLLKTRQPIDDLLDPNDRSSEQYLPDRYLKGLYGQPDVPDHYIIKLLESIIEEGLAQRQVLCIAESVVSFILQSIEYKSQSELAAEEFLKKVVGEVNLMIFGPGEGSLDRLTSEILSTPFGGLPHSSLFTTSVSPSVGAQGVIPEILKTIHSFSSIGVHQMVGIISDLLNNIRSVSESKHSQSLSRSARI